MTSQEQYGIDHTQQVIECWTSAQLTLYVSDDTFSQPPQAFLNEEYLGPIVCGTITPKHLGIFVEDSMICPPTNAKVILTFSWGTIETYQYYIVMTPRVSDTVDPQLTIHGHDILLNNRLLLWANKPEYITKLLINRSAVSKGVLGPIDLNTATKYMVYVEGKRWPTVKHGSAEKAEAEAKRLLNLEPDRPVHVISHHCTYKYVRKLMRSQ